jgi:tRNA(Arg) A34 adenosine deaminase TadA
VAPPAGGDAETRRAALRWAAGLAIGALASPAAGQPPRPEIVQPSTTGPSGFMERAFELRRLAVARGDEPYGVVVVRDDRVVGEGVSAVVTETDPTAHAELQAIRDAARRLGTRDLSGCVLYGTSRACPMCAGGAFWARISRMYHGAAITDAGEPRLR